MRPFGAPYFSRATSFFIKNFKLNEDDLDAIAEKVLYFNRIVFPIRSEIPSIKGASFPFYLNGKLRKLSVLFNITPTADISPNMADTIIICAMFDGSIPSSIVTVETLDSIANRVSTMNNIIMERR